MESGDYDPGPWRGHDFSSARSTYDAHVGRSYDDAVDSGKKKEDLVEKVLKTESTSPLVICCDVTGSMGEWPATIFSKLPYLELEGKEYLGKDMEISFAAVGDAYCDHYPLQARPFTSGTALKDRLKELVIEGGGGGQVMESYDLAAVYYANKVEMPNAVKPIFIYIGDEKLYDSVDKQQAKDWTGVNLEKRLSTREAMEDLKKKFSVYLIRKPYGSISGDAMDPTNKDIYTAWESMLGADHIALLPDAGRVVDVIFGILAKETSRVEYFQKELTGRQKPGQVKTVLKSLTSIHTPDHTRLKLPPGASLTKRDGSATRTKSLL